MNKNYVNEELTNEELLKIKKAIDGIGLHGQVDILKSNNVIDIITSKRERIRNGVKDVKHYD
jgi:hypothetical protein